jgi:DNA-binding PadR family transcriptional regulator
MSVKFAILGLLDRRPMYGYELKEEFETEIGPHRSLNFGQIYSTLARLEEKGLVSHHLIDQQNAPDRKVYRLTSAGKKELGRWFVSPIDKIDSFKDEFYIKLMLSLTSEADPHQVLHIQKKAYFHKLHELNKLKSSTDAGIQLPRVLLLDLAISHAEADIRWLEMCETRLARLVKGAGERSASPSPAKRAPRVEPELPPKERSPKVVG